MAGVNDRHLAGHFITAVSQLSADPLLMRIYTWPSINSLPVLMSSMFKAQEFAVRN